MNSDEIRRLECQRQTMMAYERSISLASGNSSNTTGLFCRIHNHYELLINTCRTLIEKWIESVFRPDSFRLRK